MSLYSEPPSLREFKHDKPTLLVCWWATSFCALMILLRVTGRFIRTERLFLEDKISALALVPLALRMACVHFILVFGTNNADFAGIQLSDSQIHQKSVASGLVLASRFFYAATLWILKYAILEFLKRLTDLTWERSHQTALVAIRWALVVTFVAVVVSGLVECRPFHHYWQVLPDPGSQCRQGYVQLITMATCNIATDALLVIFPIPIIVQSHMRFRRKLQLIVLFSLSLSVVGITIYRLPHILFEHGRQQYRSLLASVELLFATASANALVLGSFVRDRGVKKQKFKRTSAADSFDAASNPRRPTLQRRWGSDEDLFRDVGLGVDAASREHPESPESDVFTPTSIVIHPLDDMDCPWQGPRGQQKQAEHRGDWFLRPHDAPPQGNAMAAQKRPLSFLDVGGLLDNSAGSSSGSCKRGSYTSSTIDPNSSHAVPPASLPAGTGGARRGSTALLQDLGGLLGPRNTRAAKAKARDQTELQPMPPSGPMRPYDGERDAGPQLMDFGGLLK